MAKMLVYCDFSHDGDIVEGWMLYRIPNTSYEEIMTAHIDAMMIMCEHGKKHGMVLGKEIWLVYRVLLPFDTEMPNVLQHVPDIEGEMRWSLKFHKREG